MSETTTLAGAPDADAATAADFNAPSVPDAANSTSQEEPSQAPVAEQPTQEPQVAASFGGDGADAEAPEEIEIEYRPIVDFDADIDLSEQYAASMVPVVEGQMVSGQVIRVDDDEVLLDIGFKSEGVIPARELSIRRDVTTHELVKVGEQLEAAVLHREDREGRLILSKKRAQYEQAWDAIARVKDSNGIVKGVVIEAVKGGLIVDVGLRGFLPASLIDMRRVRELEPYLGQVIETKILEIDRSRNNVVLSRRHWLLENQREQREHLLEKITVGERLQGTVASIVSFGAFVDLGGLDGLIHVSELSWKHIRHPSEVVSVGDEVDVIVTEVNPAQERVSLSLRATQRDPWEEFAETHRVGELVYGRITKLVSFGAFVQVSDVVEGLVHISELSASHVESAGQVVTPGEELWVKIVEMDMERRRISLSVKQAAEGGSVAAEYQEHFGEHAFDAQGNYLGDDAVASDADEAWAEYYASQESGQSASDMEASISYEVREGSSEAAGGVATEIAAEPVAEAAAPAAEITANPTAEAAADSTVPPASD